MDGNPASALPGCPSCIHYALAFDWLASMDSCSTATMKTLVEIKQWRLCLGNHITTAVTEPLVLDTSAAVRPTHQNVPYTG